MLLLARRSYIVGWAAMPDNNGRWQGMTEAQIGFLTQQLKDIRTELKEVSAVLAELRDFKARVLAYAGMAAAGATVLVQFIMGKVES